MRCISKQNALITIWYVGRWSSVNEDIADQLRTAQATLQLWEPYDSLCTEAAAKLQQHEEQCTQLLDARMPEDNMIETLKQRIQDVKVHEFLLPYANQDLFTEKNPIKSNERLLFPLHPCTKK